MKHQLPPSTIDRSRQLRRDMTDAEQKIWRMLREHFKDWHFRRQVPIGGYYADFACHRAKLVLEIDGGQHSADKDASRTSILQGHGYRVIRFWNHDVLGNLDGVFTIVSEELARVHPTPDPSPSRGGE